MTITTIMALYTLGFGFFMLSELLKYLGTGNTFMTFIAAVALYGIVDTLVKYYYMRKSVIDDIKKGVSNDNRK
jgi:hypothetical protein